MVFLWLNIISGIIMIFIFFLIFIFDYKNMKMEFRNVKLIVLAAFLVSLAVFLNTIIKIFLNFVISTKILEFKLGNFVLALIGFFCGGALGFLSGFAADFLALIIYSSGTPVLFFTLTSVLWCIVPYYLVIMLNKIYCNKRTIYYYLPITYALTLFLISAITPIVLKYMYNLPQGWWFLYLPRIIKYPFEVVINSFLLTVVYRIFINSISLNTKFYQSKNEINKIQEIIDNENLDSRKEVEKRKETND